MAEQMDKGFKLEQAGDREFKIGESRIKILDNKIISIESVGDLDDEMAKVYIELNRKMQEILGDRLFYMIDLNRAGKNSSGARKTWQELTELDTTIKVALFGLHPVARILASFVIGITSQKKNKFFRTEEEAISWLLI